MTFQISIFDKPFYELDEIRPFLLGRLADVASSQKSFFEKLAFELKINPEGAFEIYQTKDGVWKLRVTTLAVNQLIENAHLSVTVEPFFPAPDKYGVKARILGKFSFTGIERREATATADISGLTGYKWVRAATGCESRAIRKAVLSLLGLSILDSAYDDRTSQAEQQARRECIRLFENSRLPYTEVVAALTNATGVMFPKCFGSANPVHLLRGTVDLLPAAQLAAALGVLEELSAESWSGRVAGRIAARAAEVRKNEGGQDE